MSKTIETRLQSNEVRIPKKTEFVVGSPAAPPSQYFKSSFARSLSFSQQGGAGSYADQHFTRSLDFEVNYGLSTIPDQSGSSQTTPSASPVFDPERDLAGGSKLANGVATSNGGVVKTLWSYAKGPDSKSASPGGTPLKLASGAASATPSPAAAAASSGSGSSSSTRKSVEANEIEVLRLRKECQNLIEENRRLVNLAANSGYAINGVMNGGGGASSVGSGSSTNLNGIGTGAGGSSSLAATLGLGLAGGGPSSTTAAAAAGMYSTVESVILQTQVETLQWQLKQVDSSRQMYRAVMEEVVRYLDRCYRGLDALQPSFIGRSKSVLQVSKNGGNVGIGIGHGSTNHDSDSSSASASPRARSSTNLIDVQKSYTKKQLEDDCVVPPSPASSYSTFRDFTWRRSPKRTQTLPISSAEVEPEKLAQEAFRLLRTVQNLLNTQEPTLSQSSTALDSLLLASSAAGSTTGSTSTLTGAAAVNNGPSSLSSGPTVHHHHHHHHATASGEGIYSGVVNTRSNVGFNRKLNMRGSRLSLRSSTDDSVHSTSSSNKTETDEDNTDRPSPPLGHHLHHHHHHQLVHQHQSSAISSSSSSTSSSSNSSGHLINHRHSANIDRIKEMMISSSAEDESGFSSMNSFQEIGLPLVNSTLLSSASSTTGVCSAGSNSSAASSTGSVSLVSDESSDMRDSTVIPTSNVTTIAINPSTPAGASSKQQQLSNKLGIPPSPAKAATPEIPARVTQTAAYEHHSHFVNHRRWDSAPVMPQKLKIHHHNGESDGGVSSRVLWV